MTQRFDTITGFVPAGGASQRMGRDKAALVLGGETMLARQLCLLRAVCGAAAIIGPAGIFSGSETPAYPDEYPGRGSLGDIYTGLRRTRTEFNLFLGCDLPFLEARFLRFLCGEARAGGADVTVAETFRGFQPMLAVYRRRACHTIRARLATGENKVSRLFPRARCRILTWPEIARAGFPPRIFDNMNTPADYDAAKRRLEAEG